MGHQYKHQRERKNELWRYWSDFKQNQAVYRVDTGKIENDMDALEDGSRFKD